MEELFYLLPRAQVFIKTSEAAFENRTRFAEYGHRGKHLCRLNPSRLEISFRLLSLLLGSAIAGCGANSITTSDASSAAPAGSGLSSLTCSQSSITGSATDVCTVSLGAVAGSSGLAVSLASDNSAVNVPASVTVPPGATGAGFNAAVTAVTSAQHATLTASAGGITQTYALTLNAVSPGLTLGATSLSFGNVALNTPATQPVTLTSSGTAALTLSAGNVTGAGFNISGISFPAILNPGQSATLYIQFDPTSAGMATGTVTFTSNASPATATISLSGTGATITYEVNLTWVAPASSGDPVAGYYVYRATGSSSSYQCLNSAQNLVTYFTDTTVQSGIAYSYYVESVDAQGNQSVPSNIYAVNIP